MPTEKETLQAEAESLGIEFTQRTTIAQLRDLIAAAEDTETGTVETATEETGDFLCPNCGKLADHIHAKGV